jgi:hypothetical protein
MHSSAFSRGAPGALPPFGNNASWEVGSRTSLLRAKERNRSFEGSCHPLQQDKPPNVRTSTLPRLTCLTPGVYRE